nr:putative capsid [Marmot picobirnavirus]
MSNKRPIKRSNNSKSSRRNRSAKCAPKQDIFENSDLQSKNSQSNDVSWYNANPNMLKTAGSLSFNNALGLDIYKSINDAAFMEPFPDKVWTIPGIMRLNIIPTIGKTGDPSSIVNIAARKIYAYVRHENSGHTNYDAPDLMLYILAMDNLYSFYNWITRLYGAIRLYSGFNRYYSKYLITAMGVNYDDIIKHGNDLYFMLLNWAARLKTFHIPSTMSYLTRHAWLYSQIFKDSPDSKAQTYMFNPAYVYYWGENTGNWALYPQQIMPSTDSPILLTFDRICELMEQMISGVSRSEDFNIMSGDILKAYGNNTFTVSPVDISYILEPVYSSEVLMQIHNARINEQYKPGSIISDPETTLIVNNSTCEMSQHSFSYLSHNTIVDLHNVEPSPENVMVATRLSTSWISSAPGKETLDWFGSEIVESCDVFTIDGIDEGGTLGYAIHTDLIYGMRDDEIISRDVIIGTLRHVTPFGDYPIIYETFVNGAESEGVQNIYNNFDNYTIVTSVALSKLHECALLSEFGISD